MTLEKLGLSALVACISHMIAFGQVMGSQEAALPFPLGSGHGDLTCDMEGDFLVVGVPLFPPSSSPSTFSGVVFTYRRVGSEWVQESEIVAPGLDSLDEFGAALDLEGDRLLVGAPNRRGPSSGPFTGEGRAYLFERNGSTWNFSQEFEPLSFGVPDGSDGDRFGEAVALRGPHVAIGSPHDDLGVSQAGSVYTFRFNGTAFVEGQKVIASPPIAAAEFFGNALAIEGDRLLVGAKGEPAAYSFDFNGTSWSLDERLDGAVSGSTSRFGFSVALEDERAYIGAPHGQGASSSGEVFVYSQAAGNWSLDQTIGAADGIVFDSFGASISVDGPWMAVGATGAGVAGNNAGSAYVFRRESGVWTEREKLYGSDVPQNRSYGYRVALSGTTVAQTPRGSLLEPKAYVHRLFTGAFASYGFGDGSSGPCPCGNESFVESGQGCFNSSGFGAILSLRGSDGVASDDLECVTWNLIPGNPALLYAGPDAGVWPFGDGLRLVFGQVVRLGVQFPDNQGRANWGPGLLSVGGWNAGATFHLQTWYRNPAGACGQGFNLSNGVTVLLSP